jgi:cytochrome P450
MQVPARHDVSMGMDDYPRMHETLRELRDQGPLVEILFHGLPHIAVLTYEGMRDALRDEDMFPSVESYSRNTDPAVGRTLNSMRGEEHTRNRAVVSPTFRRQRIARYGDEMIAPVCHQLLDAIAGERAVDLRAVYTHLAPMVVITRLLGLPWGDYETLERWTNALFAFPTDPEGALRAKTELTAFLEQLMAERRATPADDLISLLVNGEFQGRALADEEVLSFLRLLFPAGTHNTTNNISSMFSALLADPDRMARVREEPETRQWAVEEALRWEPAVGNLPRKARPEGGEWQGWEIPPGADMVYSFSAAQRDPAMYDRPDEFDLDRHAAEALTFGLGEHFCLGAWLARQEMRTLLDVICERTCAITLTDCDAGAPKGCSLRGPYALPVTIDW